MISNIGKNCKQIEKKTLTIETLDSQVMATSSRYSSEPPTLTCDPVIIDHIQDAIISIKKLKQQCNITRIFLYLKENLPNNEKIKNLKEACLIRQLEMAVTDGILSRKLSSSLNKSSKRNSSGQISPSNRLNIVSESQVLKLPVSDFTLKKDTLQVNHLCLFI